MFLVNGESRQTLAISDRGLQYGDGLFETLSVVNGKPVFLAAHLQRLLAGCQRLLIPDPDLDQLKQEIEQLCCDASQAVLKIIITRGSGGRGYRQPDPIHATRILSLHPFPVYPLDFQQQGISLRLCRQTVSINPRLAGIKHLNRLEQVLARAEWQDDQVQEGLMTDLNGLIIEGTMSNLFWIKAGVLHTPSLEQAGIAGIIRQIVLNIAQQADIATSVDTVSAEQLAVADEVFMTNSVIGIWPVRQFEQHTYPIGPITRRLQAWLAEASQTQVEQA